MGCGLESAILMRQYSGGGDAKASMLGAWLACLACPCRGFSDYIHSPSAGFCRQRWGLGDLEPGSLGPRAVLGTGRCQKFCPAIAMQVLSFSFSLSLFLPRTQRQKDKIKRRKKRGKGKERERERKERGKRQKKDRVDDERAGLLRTQCQRTGQNF